MQEQTKNRLWGIAALMFGLVTLGYSARIILLAAGQNDWVPVQAKVVQSHITQIKKGSGFTASTTSHFAYRYEVDGKPYTARRYSFRALGGSKSVGTDNYTPGDSLMIYHHSKRPGLAVVERVRPSFFVWMFVIFAIVLVARGVVMIKTGTAAG